MPRRTVKRTTPTDAATSTAAAPVALAGALDLTAAGDLVRRLRPLRGTAVTIDASAVRHLGAQCGQVLVSAALTWGADAMPFDLINPSAEFTEGLRLLGLDPAFATGT